MSRADVLHHDPEVALDFLRRLYPSGPWLLTAIEPDAKPPRITTATFYPKDYKAVASWIDGHAKRNIYYSVNRPRHDMQSKASKEDILAADYLHVDVDPRRREDAALERQRIRTLMDKPPAPIPRPTCAVYSGGGLNALWRLDAPFVTEGDRSKIDQLERYNIALEWALGGDHCFNVDRILRVPGTVNWPDKKKRERGRVPTMSRVEWFDVAVSYPITAFTLAQPTQTPADGFDPALPEPGSPQARRQRAAPGNVRRLDSVTELGEAVKDHVKVLIVQGHDPTGEHTFSSRSELLFYVCCELVRAQVDTDVIYAVITDPDFGISASVLDKGSASERYAMRQIARAAEEAVSPFLRQLNSKHAVVANIGGKCRVMEEQVDENNGRPKLTLQSFDDFRGRYMNKRVKVGNDAKGNELTAPIGKWWLEHEQRRQFDRIVFAPEREVPNAYNLWRGFAVPAKPGTGHERFLAHTRDNLCAGDPLVYKYLLGWMALAVQQPGRPGQVAVVLRGRKGAGKGIFSTTFGKLFGRHYLQVANAQHIVGHFNAHLRDCVILFGDEAFYAGDKKHESVLKMLITEDVLPVEAKGIDVEIRANFIHLIMASNEQWVVPAGQDERRYLVLDVLPTKIQDYAYFGQIAAELEGGGLSNLLYFLQTYSLADFNVRDVPKTTALQTQKIHSFDTHVEWWFRKLEEGILLPHHLAWHEPVLKEALIDNYLTYAQRVGRQRANATTLGKYLARVSPGLDAFQATVSGRDEDGAPRNDRAYFYKFPALAECRQAFDAEQGGPFAWPQNRVEERVSAQEVF